LISDVFIIILLFSEKINCPVNKQEIFNVFWRQSRNR